MRCFIRTCCSILKYSILDVNGCFILVLNHSLSQSFHQSQKFAINFVFIYVTLIEYFWTQYLQNKNSLISDNT